MKFPDASPGQLRSLWPGRHWWLALLLILLLGGGLRYSGYHFSLPYIDHPDEPNQNLAARMIVDWGTARPLGHDSYPPGIVAINYFFIRFFQDPATPPSTILWMVRLVSVTASVGLLVVLALFGYHLAGSPAGLLAAALWAVTPVFVSVSRFGIPDIYVTFFAVLTLWLTLAGIRCLRPRWTTYAVFALMLAILFKYQAIFLTPVILLAPLVQRNTMRRVVAGNILRFTLFLGWLLLFTPMLAPPDPGAPLNWRQHTTSVGIPTLEVLLYNLEQLLRPLDLRLLLPGWAGLALLARRRNRELRYLLVLPMLAVLAWMFGLSLFGRTDARQMVAPATLLTVMAGVGWVMWLRALRDWSSERITPHRARLSPLVALLALLILALPSLRAAIENAYEHTLPDRRNELATWADTTLAPGRFIATEENHKTLNRDWGGYAGSTRFEFVGQHDLVERSLVEWRADGVRFAIQPWYEYVALLEDESQGYLAGTTLLKAWPPSNEHRGPSMVVLALQGMQRPQPEAASQLGSIRLLGHDLDVSTAQAGAELPLQLYWQAEAPTEVEYIVFNHLLDSQGNLVAQSDGPPLSDTRRGSADWDDPQETILSRVFQLQLPDSLPTGEYRLINGWYRRDTGQRLLTPDGADHVLLATLTLY